MTLRYIRDFYQHDPFPDKKIKLDQVPEDEKGLVFSFESLLEPNGNFKAIYKMPTHSMVKIYVPIGKDVKNNVLIRKFCGSIIFGREFVEIDNPGNADPFRYEYSTDIKDTYMNFEARYLLTLPIPNPGEKLRPTKSPVNA